MWWCQACTALVNVFLLKVRFLKGCMSGGDPAEWISRVSFEIRAYSSDAPERSRRPLLCIPCIWNDSSAGSFFKDTYFCPSVKTCYEVKPEASTIG